MYYTITRILAIMALTLLFVDVDISWINKITQYNLWLGIFAGCALLLAFWKSCLWIAGTIPVDAYDFSSEPSDVPEPLSQRPTDSDEHP